jgi:hypothetical protein
MFSTSNKSLITIIRLYQCYRSNYSTDFFVHKSHNHDLVVLEIHQNVIITVNHWVVEDNNVIKNNDQIFLYIFF